MAIRAVLAFCFVAAFLSYPARAFDPVCYRAPAIEAIDGDNIRFRSATVRILNIDSPETVSPECRPVESDLGEAAAERVRGLVQRYETVLCLTGTSCGYDSRCGWLAVITENGRTLDVGSVLVEEGLAVAFARDGGTGPTRVQCQTIREKGQVSRYTSSEKTANSRLASLYDLRR